MCKYNIAVAPHLKTKRQKETKKGAKNSLHSTADIFFQCQTFASHDYLVAPRMKIMFEVCRSRVLDKTNLFLVAFLHATGLALVNLGEGDS